jgi:cysteinyl-tRNA synthetase
LDGEPLPQTVADAKSKESLIKNFFGAIKGCVRVDWLKQTTGYVNGEDGADDRVVARASLKCQEDVDKCLKDNFDTPGVMNALVALVGVVNAYLGKAGCQPCVPLMRKCGIFVTKILRILGVCEGSDAIGFPVSGGGGDTETLLTPYLDTMVKFRDDVRNAALAKAPHTDLLKACDAVRDGDMASLGVQVRGTPAALQRS